MARPPSTPVLRADGLAIGYRRQHKARRVVASDLALQVEAGELVCLLGPNGAGKSTLLRTLAGLQAPLAGRVAVAGGDLQRLSPAQRALRIGVVLTDRPDFAGLRVREVVALGRHPYTGWLGRLSDADRRAVEQALGDVDALHLARRPLRELSDGERQKVMIARALAQQPMLMLLDEPTAFLDLGRRVEVMASLQRLSHTGSRAVLLSTHDLELALRSADRLWLLPPGGPLRSGAPEDLVLNGDIAALFGNAPEAASNTGRPAMEFDAWSGSFHVRPPVRGRVRVEGEGLALAWTLRALERAGFQPEVVGRPTAGGNKEHPPLDTGRRPEDATTQRLTVQIPGAPATPRWRILDGRQQVHCNSLFDLVEYLRRPRRPTPSSPL